MLKAFILLTVTSYPFSSLSFIRVSCDDWTPVAPIMVISPVAVFVKKNFRHRIVSPVSNPRSGWRVYFTSEFSTLRRLPFTARELHLSICFLSPRRTACQGYEFYLPGFKIRVAHVVSWCVFPHCLVQLPNRTAFPIQ